MGSHEPIVVRWGDDDASVGYLGGHRWRLRHRTDVVEAAPTDRVVDALFARVFAGVGPGHEARARPQLTIAGPDRTIEIFALDKFTNGWGFRDAIASGDVGPPDALRGFVRAVIARQADQAWATGMHAMPAPPLDARFGLDGLHRAADPEAWCADLAAALLARARRHPSQQVGFDAAIAELGRMGHMLRRWSRWEWSTSDAAPPPGVAISLTELDDDELQVIVETTAPSAG